MIKIQIDTCKNHLGNTLDRKSMEECIEFINKKRESRHLKTLECQIAKFERLCQKNNRIGGGHSNKQHGDHDLERTNNTPVFNINSNHKKENENNEDNNNNNKWVKNISSTPPDRGTIEGSITWSKFCSGT